MNITERCVCGASFQIDHDDVTLVAEHLKRWRKEHKCKSQTTGYGEPYRAKFGFAAAASNSSGEEGDTS